MKRPLTIDMSRYAEMIGIFDSIVQRKAERGAEKSELLFYSLTALYHRRVMLAKQMGKPVVAHCMFTPVEIFQAMDIVPFQLDQGVYTVVSVLKNCEELLDVARGIGLSPEICTGHRAQAAMAVKGWLPSVDAIVYGNQACENMAKTGDLLKEIYNVPGFFLDRPYGASPRDAEYYARELGELVVFLEGLTGTKMDWNKLRDVMRLSHRVTQLHREVYELRRSVPHPLHSRRGPQSMNVCNQHSGTKEGVEYFETLLREARQRVQLGQGVMPEEKIRLMSLMTTPPMNWKLLDWMEREHGAVFVADITGHHWGDWTPDYSQPLFSLAQRYFAMPASRQLQGPIEVFVEDTLQDAVDHRADGAVYWAFVNCVPGCSAIQTVKKTLADRLGIPTLVIETDNVDPTVALDGPTKDKLEGFFEQLRERKGT